MTYDELDERAAGLLTTNQFARDGDLSPEVANWIDTGGFCCCQDKGECPQPDYGERADSPAYYDYDIRITNFDDEDTQPGSGVACPRGKTQCCFKSRRDIAEYQDECTPVGQSCPESPFFFDGKYRHYWIV